MPKTYVSGAFYPRFRVLEHQADGLIEELQWLCDNFAFDCVTWITESAAVILPICDSHISRFRFMGEGSYGRNIHHDMVLQCVQKPDHR